VEQAGLCYKSSVRRLAGGGIATTIGTDKGCPGGYERAGCCLCSKYWTGTRLVKESREVTRTCADGYYKTGPESCQAETRSAGTAKSVIEVGTCPTGTYPQGHSKAGQTFNYEKIGGVCSVPCDYYGQSWVRSNTQGGLNCELGSLTIPRETFSRKPKGTSYRVFPKKRKIPLGTTEDGSGCYKAGKTIF
jgi:hypothetical protein